MGVPRACGLSLLIPPARSCMTRKGEELVTQQRPIWPLSLALRRCMMHSIQPSWRHEKEGCVMSLRIELPEDLIQDLEQEAARRHVHLDEIIREALHL